MPDPFAKVRPGEEINFAATAWNGMLDAAEFVRGNRLSTGGKALTETRSSTIIRIKNETGENLSRCSVLGLDGPLFTPVDASEDAFLQGVIFRGIAPDIGQHKRRYVVTLEGALGADGYSTDGQVVRAYISGVCHVRIDIIDITHEYATIDDGNTGNLISSRFGHARILWREGEGPYGTEPGTGYGYDTGLQWAIVMLGVTGSCFAVGKANGTITARSGSTYGSGKVDLYHSTTGSYADPSEDGPVETIDVLNACGDVTPSGEIADGKYCAVAWDADDVAWVSPIECPT